MTPRSSAISARVKFWWRLTPTRHGSRSFSAQKLSDGEWVFVDGNHGVVQAEDPQDRRRTLVHLTGRGVELVRVRIDRRESNFRSRLNQMSDEELACLRRGIIALRKIIRSEQDQLNQPGADDIRD